MVGLLQLGDHNWQGTEGPTPLNPACDLSRPPKLPARNEPALHLGDELQTNSLRTQYLAGAGISSHVSTRRRILTAQKSQ